MAASEAVFPDWNITAVDHVVSPAVTREGHPTQKERE